MCKICLNRFLKKGLEVSDDLPDRWVIYVEVNEKKSCKYSIVIYKSKKSIINEIPNHKNHMILLERVHSTSLTYHGVREISVDLNNQDYFNKVIEYLNLNSKYFPREIRINQLLQQSGHGSLPEPSHSEQSDLPYPSHLQHSS